MHMRRTSILLDPGLLAELERISRRQGRPTAHAIREALEMYVEAHAGDGRTLPAFVGLGRASQDAPATATSASPADPDTAG
jgi:metal-responsive CopG/Arc/MetJ family transcriptional regulator